MAEPIERASEEGGAAPARRRAVELVERAVDRLDPAARSTLIAHPEALDRALRLVTSTPEAEDDAERLGEPAAAPLSAADGDAWLRARTVHRPIGDDEHLLGAAAVADLVDVSVQAVHARRARGALIGFRHGRRDVWFPRDQFDGRGRTAPGLAEVLAVFDGDGYAAWCWLTAPSLALDEDRPLDRLWRAGRSAVPEVVAAARGHLQGDFG